MWRQEGISHPMAADTLPGDAYGPALEAARGTYADGTPLTFEDAIERALLAAAPSIREQHRRQIRDLAVARNATCKGDGMEYPFADLLGGPGQERSDEKEQG